MQAPVCSHVRDYSGSDKGIISLMCGHTGAGPCVLTCEGLQRFWQWDNFPHVWAHRNRPLCAHMWGITKVLRKTLFLSQKHSGTYTYKPRCDWESFCSKLLQIIPRSQHALGASASAVTLTGRAPELLFKAIALILRSWLLLTHSLVCTIHTALNTLFGVHNSGAFNTLFGVHNSGAFNTLFGVYNQLTRYLASTIS